MGARTCARTHTRTCAQVAALASPHAAVPVNAALAALGCLGAGWVVVGAREAALAAVTHFAARRAGVVTCKVRTRAVCVHSTAQHACLDSRQVAHAFRTHPTG